MPSKNLLHFVREAEFKFKNRDKSNEEKINEFFECWKLLYNLGKEEYVHNDFLRDDEEN